MSQKYNLSSDTSLTLDMSQKYIYKAEKHLKCYKTESAQSWGEGVETFSNKIFPSHGSPRFYPGRDW